MKLKNRGMMLKRLWVVVLLAGWAVAGTDVGAAGKKPPREKGGPLSPVFIDTPSETLPTPLTLDNCYELAMRRSETVAIRKELIREAEARFFEASSIFLGDVDFVFTDSIQKELKGEVAADEGDGDSGSGVRTTLNDPERLERKFVIRQPLFQGFKSIAGLTAYDSFKKQRTAEWRRAEQLLYQDVASAYFQILLHKNDIQIIDGILGLYQDRLKELEEREKIGRSRESELALARSRMKILEADLARARGALLFTIHLLEFLTGSPIEAEQITDSLPLAERRELAACVAVASAKRPDVEASRQAVRTAWSQLLGAQSGFWPLVTLESNQYDRREGFQSDITWDVLFRAEVPLFRGGDNLGKFKVAVSKLKQAKLSYIESQRKAGLEVRQAYRAWETSFNRHQSLVEAVNASEENYRLQKEDYTRNLVNNLDVLASLEQLDETRREANRSRYAMNENYWRLQVATGEAP